MKLSDSFFALLYWQKPLLGKLGWGVAALSSGMSGPTFMLIMRLGFSPEALALGPTRVWNWLRGSLWSKALAKKEKHWPFWQCTGDGNIIFFFCFSEATIVLWCWRLVFFFWPFCQSWDTLFYHEAPRTIMMAVTFTANFTGSTLLLQVVPQSGCGHFPTVPTQEHGDICNSNLVGSLGPWHKGSYLPKKGWLLCWCFHFLLLL